MLRGSPFLTRNQKRPRATRRIVYRWHPRPRPINIGSAIYAKAKATKMGQLRKKARNRDELRCDSPSSAGKEQPLIVQTIRQRARPPEEKERGEGEQPHEQEEDPVGPLSIGSFEVFLACRLFLLLLGHQCL